MTPAQLLQSGRQLFVQHQLSKGSGIVLLRRTGMVRRQLQQGRGAGQRSLPVSGLLLQDLALDPLPLPHRIVGILDSSSGKGILLATRKAPYSVLSSLNNTPIDQPSETMWCMVISSTCSSSASRISRPRISGPCSRSKGAPASCATQTVKLLLGLAVLPQIVFDQQEAAVFDGGDPLHRFSVERTKVVRSAHDGSQSGPGPAQSRAIQSPFSADQTECDRPR